jgi:hypothetical protein
MESTCTKHSIYANKEPFCVRITGSVDLMTNQVGCEKYTSTKKKSIFA